jgi:hypothetical protein
MTEPAEDDNAKKARKHAERVIRSIKPPTRTGKLVVWIAPYVVGPAVEHGVRFAEEHGPELAGKGAAIARQTAPAVVAAVKQRAPVVAGAGKERAAAAAHAARQKAPEMVGDAKERAARLAGRVQERRQARRETKRGGTRSHSGSSGAERGQEWGGREEPTSWEQDRER